MLARSTAQAATSLLRILQIHKFFHPHAGSETVLFHTRDLLRDHGHEVIDFAMTHERNVASPWSGHFAPYRSYTDPGRALHRRVGDAAASVYSYSARRRLRDLIREASPDVAHLHIISHQLTMSVVDELVAAGVPSVFTMHDYKIGCPAYTTYRDGARCRLCTTGPVENVLLHRCIKGSAGASLVAAVEARVVRARKLFTKVDTYIAPSQFAGDLIVESGIPQDRVHVVNNFLPRDELGTAPTRPSAEARFFFAGRLEEVKGVREMIKVFSGRSGGLGRLVIAGAGGDLESEVRLAAQNSPFIEYLGRLTRDEVLEEMRRSRAVLVPSKWDENNPMSLLEARAAGAPVIASSMGGLPEMVADGEDGFVVEAGNTRALSEAVRTLASDPALALTMAQVGHRRLLRDNSPQAHYPKLINAYQAAMRISAAA
jgi:glycosyltransferase involved in cell wall biosynthesis